MSAAQLDEGIADTLVSADPNDACRGQMSMAGLSAKTIVNYVRVAKHVVASAVNEEGDQIYPRTWNPRFYSVAGGSQDKQHRPTVTDADLTRILSNTRKQKYVVLFALLAGTGLRIGEAIALRSTDFGPVLPRTPRTSEYLAWTGAGAKKGRTLSES